MTPNKESIKNTADIAVLYERTESISEKLDEIKNNHLFHLASDVKDLQNQQAEIKVKIAYWTGGVGVALALLQIILKFITK